MKIFATADTHGNKQIIAKIKHVAFEYNIDVLFISGDIGAKTYFCKNLVEFGQMQYENDFLYLGSLCKELSTKRYVDNFVILGNDDWFDAKSTDDYYFKESVQYKGFNIVPFELVHLTRFNSNREANENRILYELSKLNIDGNTIVIAHDVPYMCLDRCADGSEVGSKSIRKIIEEKQPFIWFGGHVHAGFGVKNIGETYVFNCSCNHERNLLRGWIFDTDKMDYEKVIV